MDDQRIGGRLIRLGPILMAIGLATYAAFQRADPSWAAWVWVFGLVLAGAGVGLAFPHLSVAAMRSNDDPVEGSKASAGIGTAQLIAHAISSALVGMLVAIGGPGTAGAMTAGFGLALLGAFGAVAAALAVRGRSRG